MKTFTLTPVALIAGWVGYTSQSIISINQIGLAVWGWVLGGAIVGYSMLGTQSIKTEKKIGKSSITGKGRKSEAAVSLASIFGLLIGFLVALPPVRADIAWRSATKLSNAGAIESAMKLWPQDQRTLNAGIVLFANNGLQEKALEYSKIDTEKYDKNFSSWYTLFLLQGASEEDKRLALQKMVELDPRNEEFKRLLALAGTDK